MERKIFIPFPRVQGCRWERRHRGHRAPAGREGRRGPDGEAALPQNLGGGHKEEVERDRGTAHLGVSGGTKALSPPDPPVGAR